MPSSPTPQLTIRIKGYAFRFPSRYAEGHQLTLAEAQALNQLLAENVRNNVDSWVNDTVAQAWPDFISVEQYQRLADEILGYGTGYQFGLRAPPALRVSPLEAEIQTLAYERAIVGPPQMAWDDPGLEDRVMELAQAHDIQLQARTNLRTRLSLGEVFASELGE